MLILSAHGGHESGDRRGTSVVTNGHRANGHASSSRRSVSQNRTFDRYSLSNISSSISPRLFAPSYKPHSTTFQPSRVPHTPAPSSTTSRSISQDPRSPIKAKRKKCSYPTHHHRGMPLVILTLRIRNSKAPGGAMFKRTKTTLRVYRPFLKCAHLLVGNESSHDHRIPIRVDDQYRLLPMVIQP